MNSTITPITSPDTVLADASCEALLDSIVQLTHRIHGLSDAGRTDRVEELRVQRGLLRAEVLRRIQDGAR